MARPFSIISVLAQNYGQSRPMTFAHRNIFDIEARHLEAIRVASIPTAKLIWFLADFGDAIAPPASSSNPIEDYMAYGKHTFFTFPSSLAPYRSS